MTRRLDLEWMDRGLCSGDSTEDYYANNVTNRTRKVCQGCPVRPECLEWALLTDERFGVWGGASSAERYRLVKLVGPVPVREVVGRYLDTGDTTWKAMAS